MADGSGNDSGVKNGTSTFSYDNNGNMYSDGTKGATITYNLLNLPAQVSLTGNRTVQYVYDAAGSKLKRTSPTESTLYTGAFEYDDNSDALIRVGLEEGQLVRNGSGGYDVHYYLRDHLGNVRQVLKEDGTVLQETEYYAFGLPVVKDGNDAANKYLYNGKEKQPETGWLDYGARMYMAELGRWGVVDPLSEAGAAFSPFVYGNDNPILLIDPDGMRTTYNWSAGIYQNERGENVGYDQAMEELGIGNGEGCCPQAVAKSDATSVAGKITPQISDGSIQLPQREQGVIKNADSKLLSHEQAGVDGISLGLQMVGSEIALAKALRSASIALRATETGSNLWKVGSYSELQGLEAGLQAHHVGQKSLMRRLVPGYNPTNAPSILVPEIGHVTNMPGIGRVAAARGLGGFTNARQVLARDIFELRRVYGAQGIPNSSLQQLIQIADSGFKCNFVV